MTVNALSISPTNHQIREVPSVKIKDVTLDPLSLMVWYTIFAINSG